MKYGNDSKADFFFLDDIITQTQFYW